MNRGTPSSNNSTQPSYGFALGGAALVIGVLMLLHPMPEARSLEEFATGIQRIATRLSAVHGGAIVGEWVAVVGLLGLCDRLGFTKLAVRAGLVAFTVGIALISINACLNGFILPRLLASRVDETTLSPAELRPLLGLWQQSNAVLSQLCIIACSIGMILWSSQMLGKDRGVIAYGMIGMVGGALPLISLFASKYLQHIDSFALFVFCQCAWYGVVAIQLIRGRF
jgi:hypothetical protein